MLANTRACSTLRKRASCDGCGRKAAKATAIPVPGPNPISLEGAGLLPVCFVGSAGSL